MSKRKWNELYESNDNSKPDSSNTTEDEVNCVDNNHSYDAVVGNGSESIDSHDCNDGINSSEEPITKMARNEASSECSHSDDVCHSMQSQYQCLNTADTVGTGFQCDSINNEISSSGISSSDNVEVIAPDDTCEVVVATTEPDVSSATSMTADAEDSNGSEVNGSADNKVSCSSEIVPNGLSFSQLDSNRSEVEVEVPLEVHNEVCEPQQSQVVDNSQPLIAEEVVISNSNTDDMNELNSSCVYGDENECPIDNCEEQDHYLSDNDYNYENVPQSEEVVTQPNVCQTIEIETNECSNEVCVESTPEVEPNNRTASNERINNGTVESTDDSSNSSVGASIVSNGSADAPTTSSSIGGHSIDSSESEFKGLLKTPGKSRSGKSVIFEGVTVYYFPRSQGFTCVPSQGGSTLGMDKQHVQYKYFSLEAHAEERKRVHKEILQRQRRFAKMHDNRYVNPASTSESEDESYDELSDISDSELEADSCYFLQPVPIRQRRALLRASGVRKIETNEKEECRDIRASREYCGCECRIYCDPETCACSLAGIKCQVDRISFPCGCTRDGCANMSGRIEFNPLRVRTHFIHTLMRIELEKKQQSRDHDLTAPQLHSSDNFVSSSSYSNSHQMLSTISCANSQTSNSFMPSITHPNSSLAMNPEPTTNSNSLDVYSSSPFSPDDSSYSENSDYTSDDYDSDCMNSDNNYNKYSAQQQTLTSLESPSSSTASSSAISSSTASLPPFPTISANSGVNAVNTVNSHSNSFLAFAQNGQFNANPLSAHASSAQSFSPQYVIHPQLYNYSDLYQRHYLLSNASPSTSSQNCLPNSSSHTLIQNNNNSETNANCCQPNEDVHQYTDLSLAIASSSAAESLNGLLSAATASSSKDNRLTPVALNGESLRESPTNELLTKENGESQESSSFVSSDCSETDNPLVENNEQLLRSDSVVGDNCDNFGEIIKKTIVETVSA